MCGSAFFFGKHGANAETPPLSHNFPAAGENRRETEGIGGIQI